MLWKNPQFRLHPWIQSCCFRSKALWGGLDCSPRANSLATSLHPILAASLCLSKRTPIHVCVGTRKSYEIFQRCHNWCLMQGLYIYILHNLSKVRQKVNLRRWARIFTERILIEVMMLYHCTMTMTKWSCPSEGKHSKCGEAHDME